MTLIIKSVLKDSSKATIEDTSTYTSPARAEYYSQFHAFKVDVDDNESVLAVTSQGTPISASEWEVTTPNEGHHRFIKLLYWVWESATTFAIGDLVERNGVFYRSILDSPANLNKDPESEDTYWAVHTAVVADGDVANVIEDVLDCILFGRLKKAFASTTALAAEISCECSIDKKPVEIQRYERLGLLIDGIAVDAHQARYSNAEKKVIYMSKLVPTYV